MPNDMSQLVHHGAESSKEPNHHLSLAVECPEVGDDEGLHCQTYGAVPTLMPPILELHNMHLACLIALGCGSSFCHIQLSSLELLEVHYHICNVQITFCELVV